MEFLAARRVIFFIFLTKYCEAQSKSRIWNESLKKYEGLGNWSEARLIKNDVNNFNRALDTFLNYSDFQPLVISIGHFCIKREIREAATNYIIEKRLDGYQFELEELTEKSYQLPIDLTWIILIDDFAFFRSKIDSIMNLWSSEVHLIIFSFEKKLQDWTELFESFWNRRSISKVLILSIAENFRYGYRFLPFQKTNNTYGRLQRLDLEDKNCGEKIESIKCPLDEKERSVTGEKLLFEDFHKLNGYPIRVSIFPSLMMNITKNEKNQTDYEMLDANIMKSIERHLNASFLIDIIDVKKKIDPFEEGLKKLSSAGDTEFVFTTYFMKCYSGQYEFTASVFEDKLCLVAPSSKPVPKFFMPLLPFSNELWLIIILYNLFAAIFWLVIQRCDERFHPKVNPEYPKIRIERSLQMERFKREFNNSESYRRSVKTKERWQRIGRLVHSPKIHRGLLRFFDLSMLAISPLQGGKTLTERAFLTGSLFFALIMIGLYQSYLVSSLSKPIYYPQLRTLRDVAESNRTIVTKYENLMRDIPDDGSPAIRKLRSKVQFLKHDKRTYDMVAYGGMISLGRSSSFELEKLSEYYDPETSRLLLHMVEECPATYSLAYVVRRSTPYLERIDRLLLRIQQAGLMKKWYEDMLRDVQIVESQLESMRQEKRVKLTLGHLSLTFLGLAIALFCSALIFFAEFYLAKKYSSGDSYLQY